MGYFISEEERSASGNTDYIEFQKGEFNDEFWKKDSLYIDAETFTDLKLGKIIRKAVPEFDFYGVTLFTDEMWEQVYEACYGESDEVREVMDELEIWVQECFEDNDTFSVLGL